jgi:thioredoxin reductase
MPEDRPHIAIIGAGPTGLEAALAAHENGYTFTLYEAGDDVASYVSSWGHVRLFSPWDLDVSPRARRLLAEMGQGVPEGSDCPTGSELVELILRPLASSDIIAPCLERGVRVVAVSREGLLKSDAIGDPARAERPFRLLLKDAAGREWAVSAEIVLDCTGNYGHPNPLGAGGIPAPGEAQFEEEIVRQIPDFERAPETWAGKTTLLVGSGYSAQTAVVELWRIADQHPATRVIWVVREPTANWEIIPEDPLPARAELTRRAKELAGSATEAVRCIYGVAVDALQRNGKRISVLLRHRDNETTEVEVDRIVSLTGFHGDYELYRQLQVHECWATSGPMKLAAALLGSSGTDCLEQTGHGADTLVNPEPNFFILGSKSYGRNSSFLMRIGWEQVDDVFNLLSR